MRDVDVTDGILPLEEFAERASEIVRELGVHDDPLVLTEKGRAAAVVMSPAAFDEMRERQRFLESVGRGIADFEAGRVVDHERVVAWMESWGTDAELEPPE